MVIQKLFHIFFIFFPLWCLFLQFYKIRQPAFLGKIEMAAHYLPMLCDLWSCLSNSKLDYYLLFITMYYFYF